MDTIDHIKDSKESGRLFSLYSIWWFSHAGMSYLALSQLVWQPTVCHLFSQANMNATPRQVSAQTSVPTTMEAILTGEFAMLSMCLSCGSSQELSFMIRRPPPNSWIVIRREAMLAAILDPVSVIDFIIREKILHNDETRHNEFTDRI